MIDDPIGNSLIECRPNSPVRQLRELERHRIADRPGIRRPKFEIAEAIEPAVHGSRPKRSRMKKAARSAAGWKAR